MKGIKNLCLHLPAVMNSGVIFHQIFDKILSRASGAARKIGSGNLGRTPKVPAR